MKLTIRQRDVLTKMAEGMMLYDDIPYGHIRLAGSNKAVQVNTFFSLLEANLIVQTAVNSSKHTYQLTDKGREVLIQKTCPVF